MTGAGSVESARGRSSRQRGRTAGLRPEAHVLAPAAAQPIGATSQSAPNGGRALSDPSRPTPPCRLVSQFLQIVPRRSRAVSLRPSSVSHMENFDVVQALARAALGGNQPVVVKQVERLAERLASSGEERDARTLRGLLNRTTKVQAVDPFDMVPASATPTMDLAQQRLGTRTSLPVDRDTGAPLCEVVFPGATREAPLMDKDAQNAVDGLLNEWRHQESLAAAGLTVSRSILLYGPPGTGKTTLALLIAARLQMPAVVARLDGLISSLLGTTARNIGALFDFCNRYQTVLILDEFDAVAKVRDDPNEVGEIKRVVNTLLQNLDKRASFGLTIAITNHELLLDNAVWRRFEHQVQLRLPGAELREAIAARNLPHLTNVHAIPRVIAWMTEGRSGADVRSLALSWMKGWVLSQENGSSPMDVLRSAAAALGGESRAAVTGSLGGSDAELARQLHAAPASIGNGDLGALFGRDRRTIIRWLQADSQVGVQV